ncbi:hypothetical protein Bbelb_039420 [Branchiostoma belcheri]|nr:hypothetical protein Bbelb_039420 [Branchiostoma belcheri]
MEVEDDMVMIIKATEGCPSGWHMHGNNCYKLVETKADWYSAESRCEQYGTQLLSISSEVENIFIDGLISNVRETRVWMGLRDKGRGWYWVDGSELIYTHWADGEPNNNGFLGLFQKDVTCASIYTKISISIDVNSILFFLESTA